jgi:hypothetical protein
MSRPDPKDIFAPKPGIFSWLRDQAYDFVYYDISAGLDFVGDLFRGPSGYSQSLYRQADKAQARTPDAKPLSKAEQATFAEMLKRTPSEGQVAYWKRKKALLGVPDKKQLMKQQHARDIAAVKAQSQSPKITVEASGLSPMPTRSRPTKQSKTRSRR